MNRKDLANRLVDVGLVPTKKVAGDVVSCLLDSIGEELSNGGSVDIKGFGRFEVSVRPARDGIHPLTKKIVRIPETNVVRFKSYKGLKDKLK